MYGPLVFLADILHDRSLVHFERHIYPSAAGEVSAVGDVRVITIGTSVRFFYDWVIGIRQVKV
ncbi:MAG: hypothetical protein WBQ94_11860 [Terracidiphilus sp.]